MIKSILAILFIYFLTACSGGGGGSDKQSEPIEIEPQVELIDTH